MPDRYLEETARSTRGKKRKKEKWGGEADSMRDTRQRCSYAMCWWLDVLLLIISSPKVQMRGKMCARGLKIASACTSKRTHASA